jgi:hypothetical protein
MAIPPLTWDILGDMVARAGARPPAWTQAATWTIATLRARLGEDWPALVMTKSPVGGAGDLAYFAGHTIAFVHLLELAVRLELLQTIPGHAKVFRAIATDPRPDQLGHATMQLELAGLAMQHGRRPELEPRRSRAGRPADVAFSHAGTRVVVETRVVLESQSWRQERRATDELFERIDAITRRHGVRCEGHIARLPRHDSEADALLKRIDDHARLVALGANAPPLRFAGAALRVVHRDDRPADRLTGPAIRDNSWERIGRRISEKVEAASASGATWLSLDAHNGLWQFTDWAQRPLARKLSELTEIARPLLDGLRGLVIGSGSAQRQSEFADEDVTSPYGAHGLRRVITPLRVRETLIIPAEVAKEDSEPTEWRDLYADEPAWLDWALDQLALPSASDIFATP